MARFYCPCPLAEGAIIDLPGAVAHHAWVVRLQAGALLTLFNGEGGEYTAELVSLDKRGAVARVLEHAAREAELPWAITLAQALPEAAKMDWIIEKAVELGVAAVQPLAAQRSVVKLSPERAEKRQAHWQAVIVAASEQCGRNRLASLAPVLPFAAWLGQAAAMPRILFSPRATLSLGDWAKNQPQPPGALCLMVGPEGGFSEDEEQAALRAGAIALTVGTRVLRTETAALAGLAALNALWGAL